MERDPAGPFFITRRVARSRGAQLALRARDGEARGRLAKTDPLDAALIRDFGRSFQPKADPPRAPSGQRLAELVTAREQLVARKVELVSPLEPAVGKVICRLLRSESRQIARPLLVLETAIRTLLESDELQTRSALLLAQPGIGPVIAATLLAHLPELGQARPAAARSPPWPASRPSIATAVRPAAPAISPAAGLACDASSTSPP